MDFLNKSLEQVSDLFRSMTPGARITSGLLLAVVVISFGYLFQQSSAGPDAFLFGGEPLSDSQLTQIEAAIAAAGLSVFEREGNRIRVPAGQKAAYLAAVAKGGALPPNFNTILEKALDQGGPWQSAETTRQRLKIARQQTISEIVRAFPWVDDAVVIYDEQQTRAANSLAVVKQITASVNVRPILGETMDPPREQMLKKLVAHAIGMKIEDVAIINLGDGIVGGGDLRAFPEWIDNEYMKTKAAFEMQKRASILGALSDIPGVRVEVNAELDNTIQEQTVGFKPDKNAVDSREITSRDESSQSMAEHRGRPGPTSQGPYRQVGAVNQDERVVDKKTSETSDTQKVVGGDRTTILKHGLTPKEVWATVTIPARYIEGVWKQRNPAATDPPKPEDIRLVRDDVVRIVENIVEPLLLQESIKAQDTYKHVRVEVVDSLAVPEIEPPSMASTAIAWTGQYWSTLAMLGVAMFSLLLLRSVVKGAPPASGGAAATAAPTLTLHTDEPARAADGGESPEESERPRLRLKKGKSIKDDLVEIVRDDPDSAAEILRSWIGKAG